MKDERTPDEIQASNIAEFMENGPGLRWGAYSTYVVARDDAQNMVLIGGLGAMGVGKMWGRATEDDRNRPGWDTAPQETCTNTLLMDVLRELGR